MKEDSRDTPPALSYPKRILFHAAAYLLVWAVFFIVEPDFFVHLRFEEMERKIRLLFANHRNILFLIMQICILAATLRFFSVRNLFARSFFALYYFVPLTVIMTFRMLENRFPIIRDVEVLLSGINDFSEMGWAVIAAFSANIAKAGVAAGVLVAVLALAGRKLRNIGNIMPFWTALVMYFAAFIYMILFFFGFELENTQAYTQLHLLTVKEYRQEYLLKKNPRNDTLIKPAETVGTTTHIILVMDESVGGKYLSLNGFEQPTTPYLESIRGSLYNYGQACASTNASNTSNLILLSGLRQDQVPDYDKLSMRQALLLDYASAAGRESIYVDAQNRHPENGMGVRDFRRAKYASVRRSKYMLREGGLAKPCWDRVGVDIIRNFIDEADGPTFSFFLKSGSHYHYTGSYPEDFAEDLKSVGTIPDTYLKSIRWNLDAFCQYLSERMAGLDVLVIYTSDHGQSFTGSGGPPHMVVDSPPSDQADVPIWMWPLSDQARIALENQGGFVKENHNRATHYQLFPTVMALMGYEKTEVKRLFGGCLFDPPPAKRLFLSGTLLLDAKIDSGLSRNHWLNPFDGGAPAKEVPGVSAEIPKHESSGLE